MYIYNILDYTHAGSLLNVCPNNTWTGKTKYFIVHCTQSVLCAGIRKMRPVYYLINVVALALAVVAAAVYNASFFRTGKFTKDPHPPQYIRQSLNVHTADATLEQIHSDETDVFSQEHAAQTLEKRRRGRLENTHKLPPTGWFPTQQTYTRLANGTGGRRAQNTCACPDLHTSRTALSCPSFRYIVSFSSISCLIPFQRWHLRVDSCNAALMSPCWS